MGNVAGLSQTITNPQNDPGFISADANSPDFHLTGTSQAIDAATTLSADDPPVLDEYVDPYSGKPVTTVWDLGAYQHHRAAGPVAISSAVTEAGGKEIGPAAAASLLSRTRIGSRAASMISNSGGAAIVKAVPSRSARPG